MSGSSHKELYQQQESSRLEPKELDRGGGCGGSDFFSRLPEALGHRLEHVGQVRRSFDVKSFEVESLSGRGVSALRFQALERESN